MPGSRTNPLTVLMYHSVSSTTTDSFQRLTVDPNCFADQLVALHEAGCSFIRFRDAPSLLVRPRRPTGPAGSPIVAVTIDDGLADAASGAAPALFHLGIPATFFVPTAYVGRTATWLPAEDGRRALCDWQMLRDLDASGWEIASHGHRHLSADLNQPITVLDDALRSRHLLEHHLGKAVISFAYPFGYHSRAGRAAVRTAGFAQAAIVANRRAHPADGRWAIPRVQVGPDTTADGLLALVHRRGGDARWRSQGKQTVWHAGRRWLGWGPPEAGARPVARLTGRPSSAPPPARAERGEVHSA